MFQVRGYHMTETVQWTTLIIVAGMVVAILFGIAAIIADVRDRWSIEDTEDAVDEMTEDLYLDHSHHTDVKMPGWDYGE